MKTQRREKFKEWGSCNAYVHHHAVDRGSVKYYPSDREQHREHDQCKMEVPLVRSQEGKERRLSGFDTVTKETNHDKPDDRQPNSLWI
ncbi:MAG: hypothetical protein K8F91_22370 [Candidatus Obscuribacterales bacterium]|nr:hypothetical protein [Candidatus Obscuribacterales bacterium]